MTNGYSEAQLDVLRELANIGSGNAVTALSGLLGRTIEIGAPSASALPFAEAVAGAGEADDAVTGVVITVTGDLEARVLLLFAPDHAAALCRMLGARADRDSQRSALGEVGNILGSSYVNALSQMTGMALRPHPPDTVAGTVGTIGAAALAAGLRRDDLALVLHSKLEAEGAACSFVVIFAPTAGGTAHVLERLGVAGA